MSSAPETALRALWGTDEFVDSTGFDIFSLLASHHDSDLVVRGGLLTAFAQ
jgi:hypothetical protein